MRMIFMVLSLTLTALGFVWKMKQADAVLAYGGMRPAQPPLTGPMNSFSPTGKDAGMFDSILAKANDLLQSKGMETAMGSAIAAAPSGQMVPGMPDTQKLMQEIEQNISAASPGGKAPVVRTPAMRGSNGARFVSARKNN